MAENKSMSELRTQSLLQKYDMQVDYLSYDYIEQCNSVKQIEKIVKILRSGEEGSYPHLEKAAEEKLRKLSPNSRSLRVDQPVLSTNLLEPDQKQLICNDLQEWTGEMHRKETDLKTVQENHSTDYQPVRNALSSKLVTESMNETNKSATTKSSGNCARREKNRMPSDYAFWDKFDAEKELLKMDLEEEKKDERKEVEKRREKIKYERHLEEKGKQAEAERLATHERLKGNECFQRKIYTDALVHYSRSIDILPSVDAYNNRAQTYLKMKIFSEAVDDCSYVLRKEPHNEKALYRCGEAWSQLGNYQNAMEKYEALLVRNPNNQQFQKLAREARSKLKMFPSKVRMTIKDDDSFGNTTNIQKTGGKANDNKAEADDKYYPFFSSNPNEDIDLNEIGTAKVMCRCNGTPIFMKKVKSLDDIKGHARVCLRPSIKRKEKSSASEALLVGCSDATTLTQFDAEDLKFGGNSCKVSENDGTEKGMTEPNEKSSNEGMANPSFISDLERAEKDLECNTDNIGSPYYFSVFWSTIKGEDDLATVSKALRVLRPEQLPQVIGTKLDASMLTLFIQALCRHFSIPRDWPVIQLYLTTLSQLQRFGFVRMMLSNSTKQELVSLLNEAEKQGFRVSDIFQIYDLVRVSSS